MKKKKLFISLLVSVIISIIVLTLLFGCAGGQVLRGTDNDRFNDISIVEQGNSVEIPKNETKTESSVGLLYGLWAITILGCCVFLWKSKNESLNVNP
jgi:hypothetical protein